MGTKEVYGDEEVLDGGAGGVLWNMMCKLVTLGVLALGNPSEISRGFATDVRASFDFTGEPYF